MCGFKSFIQSLIHLFAGFLNRTFRIDGVFGFFDGFVDILTGLFSRTLFLAGNERGDQWEQTQRQQKCDFHVPKATYQLALVLWGVTLRLPPSM
jgi:hypothetical protein